MDLDKKMSVKAKPVLRGSHACVASDSARRQINRGTWETRRSRAETPKREAESITPTRFYRESEGLIVAKKRVMTVERPFAQRIGPNR